MERIHAPTAARMSVAAKKRQISSLVTQSRDKLRPLIATLSPQIGMFSRAFRVTGARENC